MNKPLTTFNIADYCHVTHRTVQQWITSGKLKSYRTPGNHSRIQREDFVDFLQEFNMPVPEAIKRLERKNKRILVVDDDRNMVSLIKEILNSENRYDIERSYEGFSAGRKFAEFKPDLITLDLNMPGFNGYEVCRQIRQEFQDYEVKILVISWISKKSDLDKIQKLGIDGLLQKPFKSTEILNKVKQLLGEDHER